jgi:hypothetical protein
MAGLKQADDDAAQLAALSDLCELLSISTEESLATFPVDQMVPLLVRDVQRSWVLSWVSMGPSLAVCCALATDSGPARHAELTTPTPTLRTNRCSCWAQSTMRTSCCWQRAR